MTGAGTETLFPWYLIIIIIIKFENFVPSVVKILRVKSYKNIKQKSWMAKGRVDVTIIIIIIIIILG